MIKNDKWIKNSETGVIITPFEDKMVRVDGSRNIISYGLGSYGYDIRLSEREFYVFDPLSSMVNSLSADSPMIDPKDFYLGLMREMQLHEDQRGKYFIIPGGCYGLGVAHEYISMPPTVTGICIGKSTYARSGIIVNMTPVEAGWKGYLTIEISNATQVPCRVYANEGIAQILFFEGEECETSYEDRKGKYQNQTSSVVFPKM